MSPRSPRLTVLLALLVAAACNSPDGLSSTVAPRSPLYGKPASGTTDPTVTWMIPLDAATRGLAFRSDGQQPINGFSAYANGVCGVTTWVEMKADDPYPGFAHLSLSGSTGGKKGCARSLSIVYPDGIVEAAGGATQRGLEDLTNLIAPGETQPRTLALLSGAPSPVARCGRVLFGEGSQGAGVGSDSVLVTRSSDGASWHVQSARYDDGSPKDLALCENTGDKFHMPVDFVIVADDPSRFP